MIHTRLSSASPILALWITTAIGTAPSLCLPCKIVRPAKEARDLTRCLLIQALGENPTDGPIQSGRASDTRDPPSTPNNQPTRGSTTNFLSAAMRSVVRFISSPRANNVTADTMNRDASDDITSLDKSNNGNDEDDSPITPKRDVASADNKRSRSLPRAVYLRLVHWSRFLVALQLVAEMLLLMTRHLLLPRWSIRFNLLF